MSERGVYFALLPDDVVKLRNARNDEDVRSVVQDDIEERWDEAWLFQIDKAWAGIHRCLTDGRLAFDNGTYPLNACVLGGEQLCQGDAFIVSLLTPEQVRDVASALARVDKQWLREKYEAIDPVEYGAPITSTEFEYLWSSFVGLPTFFQRAADTGRTVIFTVDF